MNYGRNIYTYYKKILSNKKNLIISNCRVDLAAVYERRTTELIKQLVLAAIQVHRRYGRSRTYSQGW